MRIGLPTTEGWVVDWYTGETRTIHYLDGRTKETKVKKSFESTSKAKVEAKAKELEKDGFEVIGIYECFF